MTLPVPAYPHALYRVAITPKSQADSAKISPTLTRLCEEDPTLSWHQEPATNQTILQGMGDQHIDVAIRKAESKFQTSLVPHGTTRALPGIDHEAGSGNVPPQEADRRRGPVR